jgi:hypothetical protein
MARREPTNFRLDPELLNALRGIRDREGLPIAVQVRQAIRAWLENRGELKKASPRRAGTRRGA